MRTHLYPLFHPPPTITELSPSSFSPEPPPAHPIERVLADIHRTLPPSRRKTRRKVEFLSACVGVVPRRTWEDLADRLEAFYDRQKEKREEEEALEGEEVRGERRDQGTKVGLIEMVDGEQSQLEPLVGLGGRGDRATGDVPSARILEIG